MTRRRDPTQFIEMFGAVKKCITAQAAQAYAAVELGSAQATFLRHIGLHSPISQAELARAMEADPTLTGRVVQTLLERGLLRRERSEEDRRQYVLQLSAAGRRAQSRVEKQRADLATRLCAALDERDIEDFDRIGRKILAAFDAK